MSNMALGSQRHTKLTSAEAALLAGELTKPSWESRNEGIHERVSFEDSIWGFDLAGGSFYKTPLRVTAVKKDSRAEKAGIRPGDKLLRINDIDTSTLTIQEAHTIIIESGVHIRLAVSAPDDFEDSYSCYQDSIELERELERQRKLDEEKARRRRITGRVNQNWSLQWPWVSKRKIIYKESNCFMVPSKYEGKHRDKFPDEVLGLKALDDIVLHSTTSETPTAEKEEPNFANNEETKVENKKENAEEIKNNSENADPPKTTKEEVLNNGTPSEELIACDIENSNQKAEDTPMEVQEENEHTEDNSVIEESKTPTNDDEELEDWNPNDNEAESETAEDLEDMLNGEDDANEEEQNKIIDDVLNENEGDDELEMTDNEL